MSYKRREHWSIGEVLNLLQDEFPEVTISKIRFLEGQGLIDPERTPSGYRRFYPEDFDRLRWVLIQQRDHYLPLKVIRERLDSGEVVFEEGGRFPDTGPEQRTLGFEDRGDEAPQGKVEVGPPEAPAQVEVAAAAATGVVAPNPIVAPAAEPVVAGAALASPEAVAAASATRKADPAAANPGAKTPEPKNPVPANPVPENPGPKKIAASPKAPETDNADAATSAPARPAKKSKKAAAKKDTRSMSAPVLSLSRDELLEEAGCTSSLLNELERHGLVHGRKAGSSIVYGGDAVEIAKIGHRFASHGLDPRHLRSFRLNAEREVGLFSQIVGPQFQRRAPEARQESREALDDLTELADSLRSILMAQLLHNEFPSA